ncbi:MAG: alpha amylase [Clostridiales bacterium]|nr:alpha amylase [Clostridiales bacterium]
MKKIIILLLIIVLLPTLLVLSACKKKADPAPDPTDDNYRVFYQIFVGSFSDSDGDGIGDLRGIINRMDYINDGDINSGKSLGVQGLWLSPIFESPTYHKYDVTDYYAIDYDFGTEEDLKELVELCHSRNVKVILDLVLNHTATSNEWFKEFRKARQNGDEDNPYYDYYTCVTAAQRVSGRAYYPIPSTQWYYEGNFESGMPELNYDSDTVRAEAVKIAKYYLDMGIDGFRFDAVKYIYYNDTTSSVNFWKWYMDELKAINPDIYTVGECWSPDSEILKYYPALNCFAFSAGTDDRGKIASAVRNNDMETYANYVSNIQASIREANPEGMFIPFLTNHDNNRAAGFLEVANGNAYMAANLLIMTPGSPFIYYGEEIGMKGTRNGNTDANRRLAMLWGDLDPVEDPAGAIFNIKYQINGTVASQLEDKNSLLNHYSKLINIRVRYPEIARGTYTVLEMPQETMCAFKVDYNGSIIAIIHNNSTEAVTINLPEGFTQLCEVIGLNKAKISRGQLKIGGQTSVIVK